MIRDFFGTFWNPHYNMHQKQTFRFSRLDPKPWGFMIQFHGTRIFFKWVGWLKLNHQLLVVHVHLCKKSRKNGGLFRNLLVFIAPAPYSPDLGNSHPPKNCCKNQQFLKENHQFVKSAFFSRNITIFNRKITIFTRRITISTRRYIFIHSCFSIVMLVTSVVWIY